MVVFRVAIVVVVVLLLLPTHNHAFTFYHHSRTIPFFWRPKAAVADGGDTIDFDNHRLQELRAMTTRQLKAELTSMKISIDDVFEKEQLVQRLYQNWKSTKQMESTSSDDSIRYKASSSDAPQQQQQQQQPVVVASLFLTSGRDSSVRRLATVNGDDLVIQPNEHATVQIQVIAENKNNNTTTTTFPLSLLLDTACSGVVLRPQACRNNLPLLKTPVTMTGAGGTQSATGLTQIQSFRLGDDEQVGGVSCVFGPLPAAVQDIGALPSNLDGILGLSFLSQFACVEFDFRQGKLRLYDNKNNNNKKKMDGQPPLPLPIPNDLVAVADANMVMLGSMGVYAVNVYLGGRGPVKMLVDSGASSTIMNWQGVSALSLTRDSPQVKRLSSSMAAMGSDNVAMQMTHQICVSSNLNLGTGRRQQQQNERNNKMDSPAWSTYNGIPLDKARLCIDIGEIGFLTMFKKEQLGGILGIDALTRCSMVRMTFNGRAPRITLFHKI